MTMHYNRNAASKRLRHMYLIIVAVAYMGAAVHAGLIAYFALVGALPLALLNVGSVAVWTACVRAIRRGAAAAAVPLALAEVYVHAVCCMMLLGLAPGFQYYLWAAIPFIMFNGRWGPWTMSAIAGAFAATYVAGNVLAHDIAYSFGYPGLVSYVSAANMLIAFAALTSACLYFRNATQLSLARLKDLAITDPLTGLYNRRRMEGGASPIAGLSASGGTVAVALGDIDNFKTINDRYGHDCGDAVICEIAERLRSRLRKTDFVARWGGDEFLVVMPEGDLDAARATLEALCSEIAGSAVRCGEAEISVSMTFGVVSHGCGEAMDVGVRRADQALYRGKAAGRNCVMVAA